MVHKYHSSNLLKSKSDLTEAGFLVLYETLAGEGIREALCIAGGIREALSGGHAVEDEGSFRAHVENEIEDGEIGDEAEFIGSYLVVFHGLNGRGCFYLGVALGVAGWGRNTKLGLNALTTVLFLGRRLGGSRGWDS